MPTFRETVDVAVDPDAAWAVVGDLAGVDRWIPGVTGVRMYGFTRLCTFADGHTQTERISEYEPANRSFRYAIEGGLPVRDNVGRISVEPAGDGARVVWESSFEALDPATADQLAAMWRGALPMVLGKLAALLTDGAGEAAGGAPFVWYDLHSVDVGAAGGFYAELFGWAVDGAGPMTVIGAAAPWAQIVGSGDPGWVPYVRVDDLAEATERATKLGATVRQPRTEGPAGAYVVVADPGGAAFAIWQPR